MWNSFVTPLCFTSNCSLTQAGMCRKSSKLNSFVFVAGCVDTTQSRLGFVSLGGGYCPARETVLKQVIPRE